ncbi:MAG: HD family hydrolase [Hyphomicrobiaceae bacterium]|nr:HD family hydrolase [Hyphomicrobiaceae bacterium]
MKLPIQSKDHPRAWQRMLSGRRLDLLNPNPTDIEINDIAYGLARLSRWNGQTVGEYPLSVAQHSVIVEEVFSILEPAASKQACLVALLHDAAEYVIGDLISPFKAALGSDYKSIEIRLLSAIHIRFKLPKHPSNEVGNLIKKADNITAFYEATCLAGFSTLEARRIFKLPDYVPLAITKLLTKLEACSTTMAQKKFLQKFQELT